ncbi:MAG: DUF6807 family protein [Anaerohalosphaeraceae bacterium]
MRIALYGLICSVVMLGSCQRSSQVRFEKGIWTISENEQPLLVFNEKNITYKPYVVELFTPAGVNVLRDNVADHLHHHGLMLGWSVNGINFWEETTGCGYQVPGAFEGWAAGSSLGKENGLFGPLEWMDAAKAARELTEVRLVETHRVPKCETVLTTWTSVFSVPAGREAAKIAGRHFDGLGMRFVQSMDNNGEFVYASGEPGPIFRGDERLTESPWCAYRSAVEGKPVTVAMFDDPGNPRPATWFTMKEHFAYLSATMRLHETPLEVTADKPMTLRYGVALWDGHRSNQEIETLYQHWLRQIKQSAK